jgi:hypothetical protein
MRLHPFAPAAFAVLAGLVPAAASAQTSSASASATGSASSHEHFTPRQVVDHQQGDLVAEVFQAPQSWTDRSEVRWNYRDPSNPASIVVAVENPGTQEGLYTYPAQEFVAVQGVSRQGPTGTGSMWGNPVPPPQALSAFAQQVRGSLPGFRIVGSHPVSDLPALRQMDASQHAAGVAVRVTYELQGKAMEEDFTAAYHQANVCSNTAGGRACQTNWGLYAPDSRRAPAGALDKEVPVFTAIQSSFRQNPAWAQKAVAIRSQIGAQEMQAINARFRRTQAAGQRAGQIAANADARREAQGRQMSAHIAAGGNSAADDNGGRNSNDKMDDYFRGVTTLQDPNGGTTQRSSSQTYHWTDGNGSYRDSNDPSYNPNNSENGTWHLMTEAQ